jgi:hypothetical protein
MSLLSPFMMRPLACVKLARASGIDSTAAALITSGYLPPKNRADYQTVIKMNTTSQELVCRLKQMRSVKKIM